MGCVGERRGGGALPGLAFHAAFHTTELSPNSLGIFGVFGNVDPRIRSFQSIPWGILGTVFGRHSGEWDAWGRDGVGGHSPRGFFFMGGGICGVLEKLFQDLWGGEGMRR